MFVSAPGCTNLRSRRTAAPGDFAAVTRWVRRHCSSRSPGSPRATGATRTRCGSRAGLDARSRASTRTERARSAPKWRVGRPASARPRAAPRTRSPSASRAIEDAQRAAALDAEAQARFVLDWAYVDLGRPDLAVHSARALEIYEELGNLDGQASVLNNLGGFAYFEGRWDDAMELYERARERSMRTGNTIQAETGTFNIGEILAYRGEDSEAERCFRTAQRAWRAAGYTGGVGVAEAHLARIAAQRGHFDEAFAILARAREALMTIEAYGDVIEVDTRTAECHLLHGDPDAALALATDTLREDRAEGGQQRATLDRIRGLALLAHGDLPAAAQAFELSLTEARARGALFDVALTLDALAELAVRQGDDAAVRRSREESAALFEKLGVRDPSVVGAAARITAGRTADLPTAAGSRT